MTFFHDSLRVFKKAFPFAFPLIVLSSNLEQLLNKLVEGAVRNPQGAQSDVIFYGALSIIWSVAFPVFLTASILYFICSERDFTAPFTSFIKKHLNQLYIEIMRAWGKSLLYGLLLILPGFWKFIKLIYVPYVVVASRQYEQGQIDALATSEAVFAKHRVATIMIIFTAYIFLPLFMAALFDGYRSLVQTPLPSLLLNAIDTYFIIFVHFILFTIFKNEVRKSESHV